MAGIGKSRLAWEFEKYVDGLARDTSTGIAAAASPTERASRTGRSPRWSGCAATSSRTRMREPRARSSADPRTSTCPTPRNGRGCEPRLAHLLGLEDGPAGRPGEPLLRVAHPLRAARRAVRRRSSSSRTCSGPTRVCSTSSSTCSSGRGATRCTCSRSPVPSSPTGGRPGAPASAASARSTSSRSRSRR